MKTILLSVCVIACSFIGVQAQNLTIKYTQYSQVGSLNGEDYGKLDNMVYNKGTNTVTLAWKRTKNELPANWVSQVCDDTNCHGGEVEGAVYSGRLTPGDSILNSVYIYTDDATSGIGEVAITIHAIGEDSSMYTTKSSLQFAAYAVGLKNTQDFKFDSYPNPFVGEVTLVHTGLQSEATLRVITLTGKIIAVIPVATEAKMTLIPTASWNSGHYVAQLVSKQGTILGTRKIVKK